MCKFAWCVLLPLFLSALPTVSRAQTLPEINIPDEWRSCQNADDCAFVTEPCRSCQGIVINKNFIDAFTKLDQRLRTDANFSAKCEACSNRAWKIICGAGRCLSTIEIAGDNAAPHRENQ